MEAARDIAGVSLFLTIGVAAGALLQEGLSAPGTLAFCLTLPPAILVLVLLLRRHRHRGHAAALLLLLGCWLFLTESRLNTLSPGPGRVERIALRSREALSGVVDRIPFDDPGSAPLVRALVLGDRSGLSRETRAVFRESGASHLLALSGLHLGILYALLSFLTRAVGKGGPLVRWIRFSLLTSLTGAYVLLTGASPSLVRAFLFILLSEASRLRPDRKLSLLQSFCGALTLQLAFHPSVITSLGFQLSYLAMAGITLLYPPLRQIYPEGSRWSPFRYVWNAAALSIACQATTAPLVWWRFRSFPRYFLLTNLIALPLTPLVMVSAAGVVAMSAMGWCPGMMVRATELLLSALVWVLTVISSM